MVLYKRAPQTWHRTLPAGIGQGANTHKCRELLLLLFVSHFICTVSMLCAYAVSSSYRDRETKRQHSARQDKNHSVAPRLSSCGSCNQYLFVVAAVPMMF